MPEPTYNVDMPKTPAPVRYSITSLVQTSVNVSHNLTRSITDRGGQRWQIKFDYAPNDRDTFCNLWAFLCKQKGRVGTFTMCLHNQEPRIKKEAGNMLVSATVATGSTMTVENFTVSSSDVIKAGDFFRIGNRSKVYMVTADADSNNNGEATIEFFPPLEAQATVGDIVYFEPVFKVSMQNDTVDVSIPSNQTYNMSVEFIEVSE